MMWWRALVAMLVAIAATVVLVFAGYFIYDLLVPDPCAYHNGKAETNWLLDLFFPMTDDSGFHPEAGSVFYFSALAGGIAVGVLSFKWMKRWGARRTE